MLQPESSTVYRYTIIAPLLGVWHGCLLAHGGGLTRFYFDGSIRHLIYGFHDGWYTTQLGLWSLMCHFHASKAISRCPGAEPPPHQCSSAPSVTLATSALARPLQVGHVRRPVVVWRFAWPCRLVADARERRLRSTASRTCVVTRTYSTFGDRAFSAARPGLWKSSIAPERRWLIVRWIPAVVQFRVSISRSVQSPYEHTLKTFEELLFKYS